MKYKKILCENEIYTDFLMLPGSFLIYSLFACVEHVEEQLFYRTGWAQCIVGQTIIIGGILVHHAIPILSCVYNLTSYLRIHLPNS